MVFTFAYLASDYVNRYYPQVSFPINAGELRGPGASGCLHAIYCHAAALRGYKNPYYAKISRAFLRTR